MSLLEHLILHLPQVTHFHKLSSSSSLASSLHLHSLQWISPIRTDCHQRLFQAFDLYGKHMTSITFIHQVFKGITAKRLSVLAKLLFQYHIKFPTQHYDDILQCIFFSCIILQYTEGVRALLETDIFCLSLHEFVVPLPSITEYPKIHFVTTPESGGISLWNCWSYYLSESNLIRFHAGRPIRLVMIPTFYHEEIFKLLIQYGGMKPYLTYFQVSSMNSPESTEHFNEEFFRHLELILYDFDREKTSKKWSIIPKFKDSSSVIMTALHKYLPKEDLIIIRKRYM
jgi:hypothetical protein